MTVLLATFAWGQIAFSLILHWWEIKCNHTEQHNLCILTMFRVQQFCANPIQENADILPMDVSITWMWADWESCRRAITYQDREIWERNGALTVHARWKLTINLCVEACTLPVGCLLHTDTAVLKLLQRNRRFEGKKQCARRETVVLFAQNVRLI